MVPPAYGAPSPPESARRGRRPVGSARPFCFLFFRPAAELLVIKIRKRIGCGTDGVLVLVDAGRRQALKFFDEFGGLTKLLVVNRPTKKTVVTARQLASDSPTRRFNGGPPI